MEDLKDLKWKLKKKRVTLGWILNMAFLLILAILIFGPPIYEYRRINRVEAQLRRHQKIGEEILQILDRQYRHNQKVINVLRSQGRWGR